MRLLHAALLTCTLLSAASPPTLRQKIADTNWAGIRGANFIPSYASNTYEIWRDYDHRIFDNELRLVQTVGYNSVRLWLNYAAFEELGPKMVDHVADALSLCSKYKLRAVVNLFDACGIQPRKDARLMTVREAYELFQESGRFTPEQKSLMKQLFGNYAHGFGARSLVPVGADSPMMVLLFQNWQSTPGKDRMAPSFYPKLEAYVQAIVGRMKDNPAVLLWDVMNEPEFAGEGPVSPGVFMTPEMEKMRDSFLNHFHGFIKRKFPDEALTIGWARLEDADKYEALADVLTFHVYGEPAKLQAAIDKAVSIGAQRGKKIFITETLANWDFGTPDFGRLASDEQQLAHYQKDLPVLMKSPMGWIAWGMIVNRTFDPYTDIFYPNGQPRPAAVYLERTLKDAQPFRTSLSVSPFTELLFQSGVTFSDGKSTAKNVEELQRLLMRYGASEVYARIATTRKHSVGFGDHSLDRGLMRARLARQLGLPFNPELGLFNIYGDVRCQPSPDFRDYPELKIPGPWTSLTIDQMLSILQRYGAMVAREIVDTGVKVRIWDLGNEVDFGVAGVTPQPMPGGCDDTAGGAGWYRAPDAVDPAIGKTAVLDLMRLPEGERIAWLQAHVWRHTARIFAAVAAGIRSVDPAARFSTHVSGITAVIPTQAVAFFRAMKDGGYLPDELGFSFYPTSSNKPPDRLQKFKDSLTAVQAEFSRPVFIAELGYPAERLKEGPFASWNFAADAYPLTPKGQADFLRDLAAWGVEHGVTGIRPWAPEVTVAAWKPFALFDREGNTAVARPGLSAVAEGLRIRQR